MTILIVEDDENKRTQLRDFIAFNYHDFEIVTRVSLRSGLSQVRSQIPDLVLLDMSIPQFDPGPDEPGGPARDYGGREFLRQLARRQMHVPVIVVTQFPAFGKPGEETLLADLDRQLRVDFDINYVGAVYYNNAVQGWQESLSLLIKTALQGKR